MVTQIALNSRRFNTLVSFINIRSLHLLIIVKQCGVIELALTRDIPLLAVELKNRHGDAADRFIATTAIVHDATLLTAPRLLWHGKVSRQNAET